MIAGQYNESGATWQDAAKLLTGTCSLGTYGGPASSER